MSIIDLHTHSNASDGTDSPAELIRLAARAGIAALALTDHDTTAGLAEAGAAAAEEGLEFIRGCELAVETEYGEAHILGLWLPEHQDKLENLLAELRQGREERCRLILKKLNAAGLALSLEEVLSESGAAAPGRPHIARALVRKGFAPSAQEAFDKLLGRGRPMYAPRHLPQASEVIDLLREEGAVTVLAHPMLLKAPHEWLDAFVKDLKDQGLDAIEAWHGEHDPAGVRCCVSLADKYALALSGGSDYHGGLKPIIRLGVGRGNLRIPYAVKEKLETVRPGRN